MSTITENGFSTYEFTDEELVTAATFSTLQKMYMQTQRAAAAMDIVSLDVDTANPADFAARRSYYKGFIAACDFFLDHENAEAAATRWTELKQGLKPAGD